MTAEEIITREKVSLLHDVIKYKYEQQKRQKQSEQQQSEKQPINTDTNVHESKQIEENESKRVEMDNYQQNEERKIQQLIERGVYIKRARSVTQLRSVFIEIRDQLEMWTVSGRNDYTDGIMALDYCLDELKTVKPNTLFTEIEHTQVAGVRPFTSEWTIAEIECKFGWKDINTIPLPDPENMKKMVKYMFASQREYEQARQIVEEDLQITEGSLTPTKLDTIMDFDDKLFCTPKALSITQQHIQRMQLALNHKTRQQQLENDIQKIDDEQMQPNNKQIQTINEELMILDEDNTSLPPVKTPRTDVIIHEQTQQEQLKREQQLLNEQAQQQLTDKMEKTKQEYALKMEILKENKLAHKERMKQHQKEVLALKEQQQSMAKDMHEFKKKLTTKSKRKRKKKIKTKSEKKGKKRKTEKQTKQLQHNDDEQNDDKGDEYDDGVD
eukprot:330805_1